VKSALSQRISRNDAHQTVAQIPVSVSDTGIRYLCQILVSLLNLRGICAIPRDSSCKFLIEKFKNLATAYITFRPKKSFGLFLELRRFVYLINCLSTACKGPERRVQAI
jgi:hypothetical protein